MGPYIKTARSPSRLQIAG